MGTFLALVWWLQLPIGADAAQPLTNAEIEAFLSHATIVDEVASPVAKSPSRITLEDGQRKHGATINSETSASRTGSESDYRAHVAAYTLAKALGLTLVAPSVERLVNGRPVAVTWWVDDVLMSEQMRRRKQVEPPNPTAWNDQMQVVRVFDELIANAYRRMEPQFYTSTLWDNLLIATDWKIWLVDHTRAFQTTSDLAHPASLVRCDRAMLRRLRAINRQILDETLGHYLTARQLDGVEARRVLIVEHYDQEIARNGEDAVLYDLSPRQ